MTNSPLWMPIALGELGTHEILGPDDNPRIWEYHATTTLGGQPDEVPWCASFVGWVLREAHAAGTKSAAARSYLSWGQTSEERYGAIIVLKRGTGNQGHVGFLIDATAHFLWLVGGNQGNAVSVARFNRSALLGARWPIAA